MEIRVPHPFAFFLIRPTGWVMNLFFATPHLSATMLNTLAGGLAVLGVEVGEGGVGQCGVHDLVATLSGLSTAHLVYGSIVGAYIFAAAGLIGFYLLLQTRKEATGALVAASLFSFGLTISNFVQTFIGFAVARRRWGDMIRFGLLGVGIGTTPLSVGSRGVVSVQPAFFTSRQFAGGRGVPVFRVFATHVECVGAGSAVAPHDVVVHMGHAATPSFC